VTRRDDVVMSAGGKAAPGRENGGDDASWTYTNLTMSKNKKSNVVDSAVTNGQ
jgi:hypothetical protein